MLKFIAIAAAVLVAGLLLFTATRPDTIHVSRSTTIYAPPEVVYELLADFQQWEQWSPWENRDPDMTRTFSGAGSGLGAVYEWDGNRRAGQGRMEIAEAVEPRRVAISLEFIKPFAAQNTTEFVLVENDGATEVTWTMEGPNSFMGKVMSLFMSMDDLIGGDFEEGLANLRVAAEREVEEGGASEMEEGETGGDASS
jgi:uncharacterized protein YndB with AHSA1/START domain